MTTSTITVGELPVLKGSQLGPSHWIEVTQDRVDLFADATDDHSGFMLTSSARRLRAHSAGRSRMAT